MGRTFGLLYLSPEPLPQVDVQRRLHISAGSASMTLAALGRWGVVHRTWLRGQRREHYRAETDFWKMISGVLNERERREIAAAIAVVEKAKAGARTARAGAREGPRRGGFRLNATAAPGRHLPAWPNDAGHASRLVAAGCRPVLGGVACRSARSPSGETAPPPSIQTVTVEAPRCVPNASAAFARAHAEHRGRELALQHARNGGTRRPPVRGNR